MAKPSATNPDILPLPKGGGGMNSIDESFKTNLSSGSGTYQVPIDLPRGVNDLKPTLSLSYSTGQGNGVFGMGWALPVPNILRSNRNGQPAFNNSTDIFTFEGKELIHIGESVYRPDVETDFSRIKKLAKGWEITSKNGLRFLIGTTDSSCMIVKDENNNDQILQWFVTQIIDTYGNTIQFKYQKIGGNLYLQEVQYAIYTLHLTYEDREDKFSDFSKGLEIRTTKRCSAIMLSMNTGTVEPIKRYKLKYESSAYSNLSLLKEILPVALQTNAGITEKLELPPIQFGYTDFNPLKHKLELFEHPKGAIPPPSLLDNDITLLDYNGNGLPGIFEMNNGKIRFWENNGNLQWETPETYKEVPLAADLSDDRITFADLNGSGLADMFLVESPTTGYFPNNRKKWGRKKTFDYAPHFSLKDKNTRLLDVDGDLQVDAMHTDNKAFYIYKNNNGEKWLAPKVIKRKHDREIFPDVNFSDASIRLADVVGDGRQHIVQIHSKRIVFWPNLGNGNWGTRRTIKNAPKLPQNYQPERLFLVDIDGDGLSDIVYVDYDRVYCWMNQSGHAFSEAIEIKGTPPMANAAIVIADMKGTGTQGILWSFHQSLKNNVKYRYLELAGAEKPYLLNSITNNAGVQTKVFYSSSVQFKSDDQVQESFLPFPVNVISKIEVTDPATNNTAISDFEYYDGNYDADFKQFLGFGKAVKIDRGDASEPSLKTISYFHNDDPGLKGAQFKTQIFGIDNTALQEKPYKTEENIYSVKTIVTTAEGKAVKAVNLEKNVKKNFERTDSFNSITLTFDYDEFGNKISEVKETLWHDDGGALQSRYLKKETEYAKNTSKWLVGYPCRVITRDRLNNIIEGNITYYDGNEFIGLPVGQIDKGGVMRERHLAITDSILNTVYPSWTHDMASLGYVSDNDPVLGDGYYVDKVAQKIDSNGNPTERKNSKGNSIKIEFDSFGIYPLKIISPNNLIQTTEFEYKYGSIIKQYDYNNVPKTMEYDIAGRLVKVFRHDDPANEAHIEYQYHASHGSNHRTTLTRPEMGSTVQHKKVEYFDGYGEKLQVRSEAEDGKLVVSGNTIRNCKGNIIKEFPPYFATGFGLNLNDQSDPNLFTHYQYDALGRSTKRTDWNGHIYTTGYLLSSKIMHDPIDLLNSPENQSYDTPKIEWYDAEDRLIKTVEQKSNSNFVSCYFYDPLGQRVRVIINGDQYLENIYDYLGNRIKSSYRDAGRYLFTYDSEGNLIERQDGKGDIVYRKYDMLNRIKEVWFEGPSGTKQETYTYDDDGTGTPNQKGHLVKVDGLFGDVSYEYSKCNCLKSKTRNFPGLSDALTVNYEKDRINRIKKVIYPDGFEAKLTYNHGGLIDSIDGVVKKIAYSPTGKRTRIEYANNSVTAYEYEPGSTILKRIKTIAPDGVTTYQDVSYQHDMVGNITSITDMANVAGHVKNNQTFKYDELYQLVQATGKDATGGYTHNYAYDDDLNILDMPDGPHSGSLEYRNTSKPCRLTGVAGNPTAAYSYDGSGNLTQADGKLFEFDAKNRLTKVTNKKGDTEEYWYDQNSSRVMKKLTQNGVTQTFYNFDDIYQIEGETAKKMVYDNSQHIAIINDDASGLIFHKDHLGNIVAQSDLKSGDYIGQEIYLPFGKIAMNTSYNVPFHYNGKKYDDISGLQFFGGRYYMPEYGRFLTPDPLLIEMQPEKFFRSHRSLIVYGFVLNNPVNLIDPFGLWFGIDDLIVAAVGFVVGVVAYCINAAISGSDFSFGEMLMSGLAGAAIGWLAYNTVGIGLVAVIWAAQLLAPAVTGALDQAAMGDTFGNRFLGFLSFVIKFAASPISSTIGLLIGGFGTGFGLWGDVEWFKGGVIAFEYNSGSSAFSAVTLGATVNIWEGNTSNPLFAHELYHSRQYTYFGDTFIPFWVIGGLWGLLSSALAGKADWSCFSSTNPNDWYGNPLEDGAHSVERGGGCT
nr:SpvB/TcaC N-terminal domain-containing protein [uncultured Desulfobacter sp.]